MAYVVLKKSRGQVFLVTGLSGSCWILAIFYRAASKYYVCYRCLILVIKLVEGDYLFKAIPLLINGFFDLAADKIH